MRLELYRRGQTFWVRGRIDGVDHYLRRSLGTSDKAVAQTKALEIERKARQRALLGADAPGPQDELTFAHAVTRYRARQTEAAYLIKLIPHLANTKVRDISGHMVKELARDLYPEAAADTWTRQVIVPVRAVINHAHELGLCPPVRIRAFSRNEAVEQDRRRGKASRVKKTPGSWPWVNAFRQTARQKRLPYMASLALFMFTTGARISQAVQIRRPRDLDLSKGRVRLPAAKGHPEQWIEITTEMVVDLANLTPRNGRLFGYKSRHSIYGPWKNVCADAAIEYIPPHSAGRHGFGTELIVRQGLDPVTVAAAGRWSSPRIPLESYAHAENVAQRVREALEKGRNGTNPVQTESAEHFK